MEDKHDLTGIANLTYTSWTLYILQINTEELSNHTFKQFFFMLAADLSIWDKRFGISFRDPTLLTRRLVIVYGNIYKTKGN